MKILFHVASGEVDVSGTAADYRALSKLISSGRGTQSADSTATDAVGAIALSQVRVTTVPDSQVLITVDRTGTLLKITGDLASLAILAANLDEVAADERGGHLHIDYFPDHAYVAPGSVPFIVSGPNGGMPTR